MTPHTTPRNTSAYIVIFFIALLSGSGASPAFAACTTHSDPLGLANGSNVLFIDQNNCNCRNSATNESIRYAMNPQTPMCSILALDESSTSNKKLVPGDTVYIRQGDYGIVTRIADNTALGMKIQSAGTADRRITIKAYPTASGSSEHVTIRGSANVRVNNMQSLIELQASHYLTLDSLHFVGFQDTDTQPNGKTYAPYILFAYSATGVEIKNSSFHDVQGNDDDGYGNRWASVNGGIDPREGGGIPLRLVDINSIAIKNVSVRCTDGQNRLTGRVDTLKADGLLCDNCKNTVIQDSTFLECGHVSLNLRNSENIIVERNAIKNRFHTGLAINNITGNAGASNNIIIRNNIFSDTNQFPSESTLRGNAIQIGPGDIEKNFVYNNLIINGYNEATGITLVNNVELYRYLKNQFIFNNTIYNPGARGFQIGNFGWTTPPGNKNVISDVRFWNNIVTGANAQYNSPSGGGTKLSADIVLSHYQFLENGGYDDEFKNNLIYTTVGDGTSVKSYNLQDNGQTSFTSYTAPSFNSLSPIVAATVGDNPLFVDPANGNFHLKRGSPAAKSGTCLTLSENGFNVSVSTAGGDCHVGAFASGNNGGSIRSVGSEVAVADATPPTVPSTGGNTKGLGAGSSDNQKISGNNQGSQDHLKPLGGGVNRSVGISALGGGVAVGAGKEKTDAAASAVSIVSPKNGATISGDVVIVADTSSDVARVEFYVNDALQASVDAAPFTFTWDARKAASGSHVLQCKGYDAAGNAIAVPVIKVTKEKSAKAHVTKPTATEQTQKK